MARKKARKKGGGKRREKKMARKKKWREIKNGAKKRREKRARSVTVRLFLLIHTACHLCESMWKIKSRRCRPLPQILLNRHYFWYLSLWCVFRFGRVNWNVRTTPPKISALLWNSGKHWTNLKRYAEYILTKRKETNRFFAKHYSDLRSSTNCKHFVAFVYVWNDAFAISNGAFAVGNMSVIEVQTLLLFWA